MAPINFDNDDTIIMGMHRIFRYPEDQAQADLLLATNYLFYAPHMPIEQLEKKYTVDMVCDSANASLHNGKIKKDIGSQDLYQLANLVKINSMLPSLKTSLILKPFFLIHRAHASFQVETGDARMVGFELLGTISCVPAIISTTASGQGQFQQYRRLSCLADLADVCDHPHTIFYLEFNDQNRLTSYNFNHYHYRDIDISDRLLALQLYLDQNYHAGFQFDRDWLLHAIDWSKYF